MMSAEHHLNDLRHTVQDAQSKWLLVAEKTSLAYARAHEQVWATLNGIKKAKEAARKRDEAMMGFSLGLLTGGFVGPLTQRFLKRFPTNGTPVDLGGVVREAAQDPILVEWTKNAITELTKLGDEKLRGVAVGAAQSSPGKTDPFKPVGLSPLEFTLQLKIGVRERAIAMRNYAAVWHRTLGWLTSQQAEHFKKTILATTFFKEIPSSMPSDADLQRSAELLLFMAWGKVRDEKHWALHDAHIDQGPLYAENFDFTPILAHLKRLGAPVGLFTSVYEYPREKYGKLSTINFTRFIEWCRSDVAFTQAFKGIPTKSQTMPEVRKEFKLVPDYSTLKARVGKV